jgi:hypothetical protein
LPDKQNRGFSRFFTKGKEWTLAGLQDSVLACWFFVANEWQINAGHKFL